jgi:hypothetical protein
MASTTAFMEGTGLAMSFSLQFSGEITGVFFLQGAFSAGDVLPENSPAVICVLFLSSPVAAVPSFLSRQWRARA